MKEKIKKIVFIAILIVFGYFVINQKGGKEASRGEAFKELTETYETLMGEALHEQKAKIESYIKSSKKFKDFPEDKKPETAYYDFGRIFKVEDVALDNFNNPHLVARKHLYQCLNSNTDDIVRVIPVVEIDDGLAKSFMYYIDEFCKISTSCPLTQEAVYIGFAGIIHKEDVSVWYYYLADSDGQPLLNDSWISLHCSNKNGICALAGVFFNSQKCCPVKEGYAPLPYNELDVK